MNKLFVPKQGFFPKANCMISEIMQPRFLKHDYGWGNGTWNNTTKCMTLAMAPSAPYIGHIAHCWKDPWEAKDGWAVITAIGAPCGVNVPYIPGLDVPDDVNYNVTISCLAVQTIHQLWRYITETAPPTPAGAIRYGDLYLYTALTNLTHTITGPHFEGFP